MKMHCATIGDEGRGKNMKKGYIHIYCGDGKGKTTAAVGLGIRACGAGLSVVFTQFLKGPESAERRILERLPGITLIRVPDSVKFTFRMNSEEKREAALFCKEQLKESLELARNADMLILDEAFGAVSSGLLEESVLLEAIVTKPAGLELILTGREPGEKILQAADYISEIIKKKHPFDEGVAARKGIEY